LAGIFKRQLMSTRSYAIKLTEMGNSAQQSAGSRCGSSSHRAEAQCATPPPSRAALAERELCRAPERVARHRRPSRKNQVPERCGTPAPSRAAYALQKLCRAPKRAAREVTPPRGRLPRTTVAEVPGIISPIPFRPRPVAPVGASQGPQRPGL
jgi:hypothetical protein